MNDDRPLDAIVVRRDAAPSAAAYLKLRFDAGRDRWVPLAPERVLYARPDCRRGAQLCDGKRTVEEIVEELARKYGAPRDIRTDVHRLLQGCRQGRGTAMTSRQKAAASRRDARRYARRRAGRPSAELTHRCPLQCPYCSNPIELERVTELSTEMWVSVMKQAGEMGILQVHLSGGEPTARKDLEDIVLRRRGGLYSNLITAAVLLNRGRLEASPSAASTTCRSRSRNR